MDRLVKDFIIKNDCCNIIYLGVGLETAYDRLYQNINKEVNWYEIDLPEVIEARKKSLEKEKRKYA